MFYICIAFLKRSSQNKGSLAQLVQSTCLTSRGSLVRIQQFPQQEIHLRGLFFCFQVVAGSSSMSIGTSSSHNKRSTYGISYFVFRGSLVRPRCLSGPAVPTTRDPLTGSLFFCLQIPNNNISIHPTIVWWQPYEFDSLPRTHHEFNRHPDKNFPYLTIHHLASVDGDAKTAS